MESWRNRKTLILSRTDMMGLLTPARGSIVLDLTFENQFAVNRPKNEMPSPTLSNTFYHH